MVLINLLINCFIVLCCFIDLYFKKCCFIDLYLKKTNKQRYGTFYLKKIKLQT